MALAAAQVVDAVAARLVPVVLSGGRVYTSRLWPLTEAEIPAWRVTAEDEEVETTTVHAGVQQHILTVEAKGYRRATSDLDDALHALAAAGLTALFAGTPPHFLALTAIERDMTTEGEAAMGVITLRMQTRFFTQPSAPETIL
jgi:hypothetical protein